MQVLLWLAPAGVVLVLAMAWAGIRGHAAGRVTDREEAVRRLGEALDQPAPADRGATGRVAPRTSERSASVVVRRPRPTRARPLPTSSGPEAAETAETAETAPPTRRTEPVVRPEGPAAEPERRSA